MATDHHDQRAAVLAQMAAERSRRETLAGLVRSILAEQPSPNAVRSSARRLNTLILHIADEIAEDFAHRVIDTES